MQSSDTSQSRTSRASPIDSTTSSKLPCTVCVEGSIGCGKSTFLSRCARYTCIEAIAEPVDKWTNVAGVNLLEKFYADPATWSIAFQSLVTLTMLKNHLQPVEKPIKVMERSWLSARHCFIESMLADGILPPCNYEILRDWNRFIKNNIR